MFLQKYTSLIKHYTNLQFFVQVRIVNSEVVVIEIAIVTAIVRKNSKIKVVLFFCN